jgi:AraC family transcriptional regulator
MPKSKHKSGLKDVVGGRPAPTTATLATTPDEWAARLSGPACISSCTKTWPTALLRHWIGTSPEMDQPALDRIYIAQHLGGAKHVERRNDGRVISTVVEKGALTIVPAGTQFKWHTRGPIEFAHLYFPSGLISRAATRFKRSHNIVLLDSVGFRDPLLEALYGSMLAEVSQSDGHEALYLDTLLEAFVLQLLRKHSTSTVGQRKPRESLPRFQLQRVLDFIEAKIDCPLKLSDLASVGGGTSVFHFSRAFKNSAGQSPYRYVLQRRVDRAMTLIKSTEMSLMEVASVCGFRNIAHLSKAFSRLAGVSPRRFRRDFATKGVPAE